MKHSSSPPALAFLDAALAALDARAERRVESPPLPAEALSFCSNDYLGLSRLPPPAAPSSAGASRLLGGERAEHQALEARIGRFLGTPGVLAFTSGYAANVGILQALAGAEDLVVSDALNHASIIDGARLSRARVAVTPHLDVGRVREALAAGGFRRAFVVVESYYSMDADGPDLGALREACDAFGAALIVDEAHALGILGPGGRGRLAEAGVRADVTVGTLGKALGAQGAFAAGSAALRTWLWNRARSFVFSTGLAPSSAAAAERGLAYLESEPGVGARVLAVAEALREGLRRVGPDVAPLGFGHVVPVIVGDVARTLALATALRARGVEVHAVRPPTVPAGSSRLRLTITARHTEADVDRAVRAFREALSSV